MKKITMREFARNRADAVNSLKSRETLAVTERGKTIFLVTKPAPPRSRRLSAAHLLSELRTLPMTNADGDLILKQFVGETLF